MTNILTEKVKEIQKQFNIKCEKCDCEGGFCTDLCTGLETSGYPEPDEMVWKFIKDAIIDLLEADVEIRYKQQAIDELKKLSN